MKLTDDELAKLHLRHLVGGKSPLASDEVLYRFEFPERPGATETRRPSRAMSRSSTTRSVTTSSVVRQVTRSSRWTVEVSRVPSPYSRSG